jgi:membrane-anchored protein YejM (alkaline phosphatase superfamily)
MQKLSNCVTQPYNYSLGTNLLDTKPRPYLIIGSYIDFGVLDHTHITHVFPAGNYRLEDLNGQPSPDAKLDPLLMEQVFHDMRRFYKS